MPRDRQRLTLESGPKLDLAKLIPNGLASPAAIANACSPMARARPSGPTSNCELSHGGHQQTFSLVSSHRHFGGLQWYAVYPRSGRKARVFYRPLGATYFASRHAWSHRAAYASQFLDPVGRPWRTKAKVKAALLGDADPNEWDVPPKPKGMRWATYERWVARYDAAEEELDRHLLMAAARLMKLL